MKNKNANPELVQGKSLGKEVSVAAARRAQSLSGAGPAGRDSDKCLMPQAKP
jgi:hypothetical protein